MRRLVLIIVLSSLLGSPALAAGNYPPIEKKELYAQTDLRGKTAPELVVEQWLTGKEPDTKGKVVLMDFWATWCGPCRELIPELNGYQKKFGDDLVVIGISDENADTLKSFMKSHRMQYNVATDTQAKMKSALGVKGIPHVLVISPDHIVRWQGFPQSDDDPLTEEKLDQIIKASK